MENQRSIRLNVTRFFYLMCGIKERFEGRSNWEEGSTVYRLLSVIVRGLCLLMRLMNYDKRKSKINLTLTNRKINT